MKIEIAFGLSRGWVPRLKGLSSFTIMKNIEAPEQAPKPAQPLASTEVAGKVPALTLAQIEIQFKERAREAIQSASVAAGKYLTLAEFVREHKLARKQVGVWGKEIGLHKVQCTRIFQIGNLPDDEWNQLKTGLLSWRGAERLLTSGGASEEASAPSGGKVSDDAPVGATATVEAKALPEPLRNKIDKLAKLLQDYGDCVYTNSADGGKLTWRGSKL